MGYNIAIIGATGLVGRELVKVIFKKNIPIDNIFLFSSQSSAGKLVNIAGKEYNIQPINTAQPEKYDFAFFATDSEISKKYIPEFIKHNVIVIDKSRAYRYDDNVPLVVPQINPETITTETRLIANPNCTTTQLVMTLAPLRELSKIEKIVATSCQSVSGAGHSAIEYLKNEITQNPFPYEIKNNIIPYIGEINDDNYCDEEIAIIKETNKIMGEDIDLAITTLRVPITVAHTISTYVRFEREIPLADIINSFKRFSGLIYTETPPPMPLDSVGKNEVFVGRLRNDLNDSKAINFISVADNLRKGAATNAVEIMEMMIKRD